VKSLAIGAGALTLATGTVLATAAPLHHPAPTQTHPIALGQVSTLFHLRIPVLGRQLVQPASAPAQAAATQTAVTTPVGTSTPVPGGTQTPTPSPTPAATSTYPDPNTILQNTFSVYQLLRSVHYELVTDGEQTSIEKVHLDAKGDVTCKNSSISGRLTGSDTLEGTSQTTTLDVRYIQIKKKVWLKSKQSHSRWAAGTPKDLSQFGITVNNILFCSSSTSSGGTNNTAIKDLTNVGPDTFQGVAVWHIRATQVTVDSTGKTSEATLDFLISQDHFLPYVFTVTIDDTVNHVTLVQKQILTQFGKKVNIKAPKIGSTTP
jgi:hypothetical protein